MQRHADDDSFEIYLKQFRPRAPEALFEANGGRQTRRALALGAWAAAILLIAALLSANWTSKPSRSSIGEENLSVFQTRELHPLTIRNANELLARAPSFKAAMDELVLAAGERTVPKSQSAFAALSQENSNP